MLACRLFKGGISPQREKEKSVTLSLEGGKIEVIKERINYER